MKRGCGAPVPHFSRPATGSLFKFHDAAARNRRASRPNSGVITKMTREMDRFRGRNSWQPVFINSVFAVSSSWRDYAIPFSFRVDAINIKMRILNRCIIDSLSLSPFSIKGDTGIAINAIFISASKRDINHPHHMRISNKITIQFVFSILYLFG